MVTAGKRMRVHMLTGAVLLTVAWGVLPVVRGDEGDMPRTGGTIAAGQATYRARDNEHWAEKGRIIGGAGNAPAFKVEAVDADGKVAGSREFQAGAKGFELPFLAPGAYMLRVTAAGYKTLDVRGLEVRAKNDLALPIEFTTAGGTVPPITPGPGAKIVAGAIQYRSRTGGPWEEKGRVVGRASNAPAYQVDVIDTQGSVALSHTFAAGTRGFELQWLKPGFYTLKVTAEAYPALEVKNLEVKAGNDLLLPLEFTR